MYMQPFKRQGETNKDYSVRCAQSLQNYRDDERRGELFVRRIYYLILIAVCLFLTIVSISIFWSEK